MSILKAALQFAVPLPSIESFERYMFVGPHPDDIEIGAGATAAKLAAAGKKVAFLICTDGRYGDGNAPKGLSPAELAELRKKEAQRSAALLGAEEPQFLDLSDGGFYEDSQLLEKLAKVVGKWKPDMILAPDPSVTNECHADHLNVGKAVRQLACFAPYAGIMAQYGAESAPIKALGFYMTAKPNRYVKTRGFLERQRQAIFQCHVSQFPAGAPESRALDTYLKLRAYDYGLRSLKGCAEGFRVLGTTHMHCLPEFGD